MSTGSSRAKGGHASVDLKNIIKVRKNVRLDGVDEKCVKENIKYYKWSGTKGSGLHPSQVKMSTSMMDYIPPKQKPNTDLSCAQKRRYWKLNLICSYTLDVFTLLSFLLYIMSTS